MKRATEKGLTAKKTERKIGLPENWATGIFGNEKYEGRKKGQQKLMSEMTEMKKGNGKMGNGSWATEKLGDEKWAGRKKTTQSTVSVRNIPAAQLSVVVFFQLPFLPLPFLP